MSEKKNRTIIRVVALIGLFIIAFIASEARCADENGPDQENKLTTKVENTDNKSENLQTIENKSGSSLKSRSKPTFKSGYSRDLYMRMIISVVMVCVLGAAAFFMSKRVLPKLANLKGKQIKVIETVHLGSRKSIHLIEFDNRRILIGSTSEQITKLSEQKKTFSEHLEKEISES